MATPDGYREFTTVSVTPPVRDSLRDRREAGGYRSYDALFRALLDDTDGSASPAQAAQKEVRDR